MNRCPACVDRAADRCLDALRRSLAPEMTA